MLNSPPQDVDELKQHVTAIASFLRQHEWLLRSHVVDFFKGLWEKVDEEWNSCLRTASAESWLLLPSGVVKEEWPESLKEFMGTASRLSLSRDQVDDMIGVLAALIAGTAKLSGAKDVIDVGAGQGYLALVLAFEYLLAVIAVCMCSPCRCDKQARCAYRKNRRSRKSQQDGLEHPEVRAPQTVTCFRRF